MTILYIYRNPNMGVSIGKVFKPIEQEMKKYAEIDSIYLPSTNYSIKGLGRNILYVQKVIIKKKYDIIHITGTENYLLPILRKKNTIVTVHDIGSFFNKRNKIVSSIKKKLFISTLKFAKIVTFISEKSQTETLQHVSIKSKCSVVIHNPISHNFPYSPKLFNEKKPCILHIGTKPNKNLTNTISAIKKLNCKLSIIGALTIEQAVLLKESNIEYCNKVNISDDELYEEYKNCDIVNFPSLYEGFGMPIIEGQSVGRVVITSNLSPMKDIAKDSAILVNPLEPNSILEGYKEAIINHSLYIERGLENIKRFDLGKITLQYLKAYQSIL